MSTRREYILAQRELGLASEAELDELFSMPTIIDGGGEGVMVMPPPLRGANDDERLANFLGAAQCRPIDEVRKELALQNEQNKSIAQAAVDRHSANVDAALGK